MTYLRRWYDLTHCGAVTTYNIQSLVIIDSGWGLLPDGHQAKASICDDYIITGD